MLTATSWLTDFCRILLIAGFGVLAVAIPGVVLAMTRSEHKMRVVLLLGVVWFLLAAGIYAVARDWGNEVPLTAPNDVLRGLALASGLAYLYAAWRAWRGDE
jgi:hypothetical protein